ncbi:MAG: YvcK family protein [Desulfobulbaceae bacterium]|uniref:YvcK family protein n=1 Tax=Candidatus Desulfatifera sulfidica TaxID=2841691 RepID=A0A8J6TBK3_9BACT|nr:YvcK family protein [Candidatus Desulfatifera sulfidica]
MIGKCIKDLLQRKVAPLDILPQRDLREKLVDLVMGGVPERIDHEMSANFQQLRSLFLESKVDDVNVVVFGGGTGLSNLIGGDSRSPFWVQDPFSGLKTVFPATQAVVCTADDGGSTGELLKELPLIALGDIRHVLLSSIQLSRLQILYGMSSSQARDAAGALFSLFNYRYKQKPESVDALLAIACPQMEKLPVRLHTRMRALVDWLFSDRRLDAVLGRPNCLGNLLIVSAIYSDASLSVSNDQMIAEQKQLEQATYNGLVSLSSVMGVGEQAVLPCTATQSLLSFLYVNGVEIAGEHKSDSARRGYPVDRVYTDFCAPPHVYPEVLASIEQADILILAPGSLYSSLIPVFQTPEIAQAVRANQRAMKILVSNLWVQAGETDQSIIDPERKFYVSDMIRAYERNIPGGIGGLVDQVLCLSLNDIPASVFQDYGLEGKAPIYLDREKVQRLGFLPLECGIFSRKLLDEHRVIQHDPEHFAQVVKALWLMEKHCGDGQTANVKDADVSHVPGGALKKPVPVSSVRYQALREHVETLSLKLNVELLPPLTDSQLRSSLVDILWLHKDIPLEHLNHIAGVHCVSKDLWHRSQKWDQIYSFYDPVDQLIKIRSDQFLDHGRLEVAFLIGLGESLLGRYAARKEMSPLEAGGVVVGKIFDLFLAPPEERDCYFIEKDLSLYLTLARLLPHPQQPNRFTRVINGHEGFTPPGLMFGLYYAWYLDNRFSSHIEYKMAIRKIERADMISCQIESRNRRQDLVTFFREVVFAKERALK